MKKIKLVIADRDREYVRCLENYILLNHPGRFELYSVTSPEYMAEYEGRKGEDADILLLGREFAGERAGGAGGIGGAGRGIPILLSEEQIPEGCSGQAALYKYCHAEKLIGRIIAAYSDNGGGRASPDIKEAGRIIAVYSAAGGSGKSSIAACGSVICARRGAKVLYLSLEEICSTSAFFHGSSGRTFSHIIYHLKEKHSNLPARIEGARCIDPDSGVSFFEAPDSAQHMEELTHEEVELLVDVLKKSCGYDFVFIDLPCGFCARNVAALKACDCILNVSVSPAGLTAREGLLKREYAVLRERFQLDVEAKSLTVFNMQRDKHSGGSSNEIGFYPELWQVPAPAYKSCTGFYGDMAGILANALKGGGRYAEP